MVKPATGRGGGRGPLLAGMAAGVVVLAVAGVAIWMATRGDDPTTGGETAGATTSTSASSTTVPEESRIGTAVGGTGLLVGDCVSYDLNAVSIATFDLVACDSAHTAEVTGLLEHPDAAQQYPGADELFRFAEGCAEVTEGYLGVDVYRTTLAPNVVVPEKVDWDDGMYWAVCMVGRGDLADLTQTVAGEAETLFPRGSQVVVRQLAAGDCFGPTTEGAEMISVGPDDLVDLLPCDDHHPGYFFGRAPLHDWAFGEPWPGSEAVDAASDAACDLEFTEHFGVDANLGFKYRYWRPIEETWPTGAREALCMVADDRGVPPTLDFRTWEPVIQQAVGTCFIFPPDTEYTTLDGELYVGAVPCEAFHHGEMFGSGDLPEGPFPDDVATATNLACEEHFVDYIGRSSADSYYGAYVFWSPLAEEWDLPDGRRYACSLLYEAPLAGSARGSNT